MQSDEWIAAIGSYVRNAFGNRAALIAAGRRRAAACGDGVAKDTVELRGGRRVGAARGAARIAGSSPPATTRRRRATPRRCGPGARDIRRQPGMWLQIELPQPAMVAGVQFESPAALVDTTPAVPGAPTRTGIGGGRGGGPAPQPAFPRGYEVVVSTDGTTWSNPSRRGRARASSTRSRSRRRARSSCASARRAAPTTRRGRSAAADPGSAGCGGHGVIGATVRCLRALQEGGGGGRSRTRTRMR